MENSVKKILVVDDEEDIREFLQSFFENKGYSVCTAGTREDAQQLLQREMPLVVLLDIRMRSQRDGLDILSWMKQQGLKTKTIMVTADENKDVITEAYKLGADDYIIKPLSLEYLQKSVTQKIENLSNG